MGSPLVAPTLSRWAEAAASASCHLLRIHETALPAGDHQHGQCGNTTTNARLLECKVEPASPCVYIHFFGSTLIQSEHAVLGGRSIETLTCKERSRPLRS